MTDRKKPGWAFWATVGLVVVLVGYPLSFGPACWIYSRADDPSLPLAYLPIGWILVDAPDPIAVHFVRYAMAGMRRGSSVAVPFDTDDDTIEISH